MSTTKNSVQLSVGRIASLACLLEVCASKPGNVHRGADFDDMTMNDFVVSAELFGHTIDSRQTDELGLLILNSVDVCGMLVPANTNLGIILLICPMAIAANDGDCSSAAIRRLLKATTADDAKNIYQAIRNANPGGMGSSDKLDISGDAPEDILDAMQHSSDKDQIALQYTNNFEQVFDEVVPLLVAGQGHFDSINEAIIYAHVSMIARHGDSLIQRKCGQQASEHAKMLACKCLDPLMENDTQRYSTALEELDFWMRSDGNNRNPGTTADLITAAIFAAIVNNEIAAPFR